MVLRAIICNKLLFCGYESEENRQYGLLLYYWMKPQLYQHNQIEIQRASIKYYHKGNIHQNWIQNALKYKHLDQIRLKSFENSYIVFGDLLCQGSLNFTTFQDFAQNL